MGATSSRLLQLLSLLQARRDWPGAELADRLEVSGRTIRRDVERLRFAYESRDGSRTRREVEPHSLLNHGRRWYLVAFDRDRGAWRTFRVDRLSRPASTGVRFQARRLPARDAAAYLEQSIT